MFGVILILVVTLMQGYVFWRAASTPFVRRHISQKRLFTLGFALWALFLFCRIAVKGEMGSLTAILEFLSMTWLAVLFLMSVALFTVEILTCFGFFLKKMSPNLRELALVVGGILSVIALIQGLRAPIVQSYDVYLAKLPRELDGTVIVALSDLHLGTVLGESWLVERVKQVQAEKPDVVVLIGDIFEGRGTPGNELLAALRRISAPLGVWAVSGNHEYYGGFADNSALFEKAGAHLLLNTWVELRPGLILAGVGNLSDTSEAEMMLAKSLAGRPSGVTILLSHAPLLAFTGKGADLMLSGHTHGGQIWPFGYLVQQRFPLLEGRYEIQGMTAIVSRGAGAWGPRMRLWHPADFLRVTLHTG